MYNHAPKDYICPICLGVKRIENEDTMLKQADLVYKDEMVSVFINSFWIETTEGHIIVVPNKHYENLYELPEEDRHRIIDVTQKMAIAMKKAYRCDGITLRQNNEPASDQHAFHFHLHIFPRYNSDSFNENCIKKSIVSNPEDRLVYVKKLQDALQMNK